MHVLINGEALTGQASGRGLGRYTTRLRDALSSTEDLTVHTTSMKRMHGVPPRLETWASSLQLSLELRDSTCDIYHATSVYEAPFRTPRRGVRFVLSIQDIIPLDLDEYTQTGVRARFFHNLANRADAVLVQSAHTKSRVMERLGVEEHKIFFAPLPVSLQPSSGQGATQSLDELRSTEGRFVVTLADLRTPDPRKRFEAIFNVAEKLASLNVSVVFVGAGTENLHLRYSNVFGLGRLTDSEMSEVYAKAEVFLYATRYEGQGLPPQEALAVGTPVVAPANSSLPEMIGPGGLFVPESSSSDELASRLFAAVKDLLTDRSARDKLGREGQHHVGTFTDQRFKKGVLAAYQSVIG